MNHVYRKKNKILMNQKLKTKINHWNRKKVATVEAVHQKAVIHLQILADLMKTCSTARKT